MAKSPALKVVFDTNVLHCQSACFLLSKSAREFVEKNSQHKDVRIAWILPGVVVRERQFQMMKAARAKLPAMRELERLLRISVEVNEENLAGLVRGATDVQLKETGIEEHILETERVDWDEMINAAASRIAPFADSDNEKGFRDALVLESFAQVVQSSPKTPSVCRVVLVTSDGLLGDAAKSRLGEKSNVRVLKSLDQLQQLINSLVSKVTEEFVDEIRPTVERYFHDPQKREGLYTREKVRDRICQEFRSELAKAPSGCQHKGDVSWEVGNTQFDKKNGQRTFWTTRIHAFRRAKKPRVSNWQLLEGSTSSILLSGDEVILPALGGASGSADMLGLGSSQALAQLGSQSYLLPYGCEQHQEVEYRSEFIFVVAWRVSISTQKQSLSKGKVEDIQLEKTDWHRVVAVASVGFD